LLSFSTNLANELRDRHASAYWYIKLYYGDESSFTGLSDSDRILDGDKYRGLVLGWGGFAHSVVLDTFTTSTAALNNLTISNKDDAISGGRFSDLFNSQNYVNRKFTLHMGAVGVAFADHAQVAQGIITDQVKQNANNLTLRLVEDISSVQKEIPATKIDSGTYANAPAKNVGKPFPLGFGDFGLKTDIGTIPSGAANFDRHFVKGHFPAIITDKWNDASALVFALPDQVDSIFNDLNTKRVFYYGGDQYSPCEDSNVVVSTGFPYVAFKGETWRIYVPLETWDTYDAGNYPNMIDGDFSTPFSLETDGSATVTTGFRIPKMANLGTFTAMNVMFDIGNYGGNVPAGSPPFKLTTDPGANDYVVTWNTADQIVDITAEWTTAQKDSWDFESNLKFIIDDTGGALHNQTVEIYQIGIEIEFSPSQNFQKAYNVTGQSGRVRGRLITTPEVSDYIYYSGKGREYGSWVDADSRNNGYDQFDLIENPVYMIEDILRTELGLSSSEIDYASFDTAGNTTDGEIAKVFDLAVGSILFAFSQYKIIDAWALCQELAEACGCLLFFSGTGTIKIVVRHRDEDYTSADRTLKYDELANIQPDITPLNIVKNRVSVRYDMDYAQDVLQTTTAVVNDTTSQGNGATGIGGASTKIQELIQDNRFILDSGTAIGHSTALLDWLAYRKKLLSFDVITPKHNDLEIGDTVVFSGWPDTFKIYGNEITATDIYMVTRINKVPNGCAITCQEVSEVGD
jgi:hypothetical protein